MSETISKETIVKRIETLKKERDEYITQVNQQVAVFGGAIIALEELIKEQENGKPEGNRSNIS